MSGNFELYRCTECGKTSVSLGWLHGHIDGKHRGIGPWNIIPWGWPGDFDALMEHTEVVEVEVVDVQAGGDGA